MSDVVTIKLPMADGTAPDARVATATGMGEVALNGEPHLAVYLSVDEVDITVAVFTADEAHEFASSMSLAALTLSRRLAAGKPLPGLPGAG